MVDEKREWDMQGILAPALRPYPDLPDLDDLSPDEVHDPPIAIDEGREREVQDMLAPDLRPVYPDLPDLDDQLLDQFTILPTSDGRPVARPSSRSSC